MESENSALTKSEAAHEEMRELIAAVRSLRVTDPAYDRTVRQLMGVVLHHVADEESVLLPLAETRLADELGELGRKMMRRRMELLRPHLGEAVRTSARSFPVAVTAVCAGLIAFAWLAARQVRGRYAVNGAHRRH